MKERYYKDWRSNGIEKLEVCGENDVAGVQVLWLGLAWLHLA